MKQLLISIDVVEKILMSNGFITKSTGVDSDIIWGHSELREYNKDAITVYVQYQHLYNKYAIDRVQDEVWGFIFSGIKLEEHPFNNYNHRHYITVDGRNIVSHKCNPVRYSHFNSIKDIKLLFKFAANIKLKI